MDIFKIKSSYFNMILKISKLSKNYLKSDFAKSSIKSLNTLRTGIGEGQILGQQNPTLRVPSTKGNRSRISLPNWLSN
jgi:hypothetical protein